MKAIGIEALLRWAYCEELPKAQGRGGSLAVAGYGRAWGGTERFGELLTIVDAPVNGYGVVPDFTATTEPHPDALAVHAAVSDMDGTVVGLPEGWAPLVDLIGPDGLRDGEAAAAAVRGLDRVTVVDADGDRVWRGGVAALVRRHAVLGDRPDWRAEMPERRVLTGANGKPKWFRRQAVWAGPVDANGDAIPEFGRFIEVEVDGFDPKRREPYPDAYAKELLEPDPGLAAEARAEWEVWRAAVAALASGLGGEGSPLVAHRLLPFVESARPWVDGEVGTAARVLPDLRAPSAALSLARAKSKPGRRAAMDGLAKAS